MKNHFEHFQAFIEEQKKWFEQHLSAFIGIAVDSLKAHRRAWGKYMARESRPNSPKREKIRECALKHAIVALTFSCNVKNEQLPGRVTGFGSTHMVKNPPGKLPLYFHS
ncbi:TPA: hypothetical protein ACJFMQ_004176 [Escherichia coli]